MIGKPFDTRQEDPIPPGLKIFYVQRKRRRAPIKLVVLLACGEGIGVAQEILTHTEKILLAGSRYRLISL